MAVLALAGTGCAGSDGTPPEQAGGVDAPLTTTSSSPSGADAPDPRTTPTGVDATGPTCAAAVEDLRAVLAGAADLPEALQDADLAPQATAAGTAKVLDSATRQAQATGQDEAEDNLGVLATMASEVQAALAAASGESPSDPMAAFTPAYFEHGYAAAALRELAETANLAPCGEVADLVVGADG